MVILTRCLHSVLALGVVQALSSGNLDASGLSADSNINCFFNLDKINLILSYQLYFKETTYIPGGSIGLFRKAKLHL